MADITTTRIFTDGERGITAAKMNDIVGGSVIQPAFYTSKPTASTLVAGDKLLALKSGSYSQADFQTVIDSVSAAISSNTEIWSVRLRSFNAVGNPNFECDQVSCGAVVAAANAKIIDRWGVYKNSGGTAIFSGGQQHSGLPDIVIPGTSFRISSNYFRVTLTTAQPALSATDGVYIQQAVEGPQWRELSTDVHSMSLLVRSSVAGLKFGCALLDSSLTKSLTKLCTIPSTAWTLIQLPDLPIWPNGGSWSDVPGNLGYYLFITLAAGTGRIASVNDTWQNGSFFGAAGQSNFAASPVNSTFDVAFVQHEPGPVCSQLMDKPFTQNLDECLRYYQKSYDYSTARGAITGNGAINVLQLNTSLIAGPKYTKPLAIPPPGFAVYNHTSGASGSFSHLNSLNYGITGIFGAGEKSVQALQTSTMPAPVAGASGYIHYVADTGW